MNNDFLDIVPGNLLRAKTRDGSLLYVLVVSVTDRLYTMIIWSRHETFNKITRRYCGFRRESWEVIK